MLTYTIQLNRNGIRRFAFSVPACESGVVGDYSNGTPYQPNMAATEAALPFQYRKSFNRARLWWQSSSMSGRKMPLMCDLYSTKGVPMGTLFATPNWEA